MRVLLIHTSGAEGSVALADTELPTVIAAREMLPGRSSSERLVPAVKRLMEASGWTLRELAAIVVVNGPGSFTGVRVGLSAAKGLSEASGVPMIAVSRLALLAACAGVNDATVYAVLDAGRGEFYLGEYLGRRCVREALLSREDLVAAAAGGAVVVCEAKVAEGLAELHPQLVDEPLAEDALPFALERIAAGEFDDAALVDANYLRRTDLEIFAKAQQATTKYRDPSLRSG
jgi:tRNA threonylcarbamoyladenosine biosynthesis protein TsaB